MSGVSRTDSQEHLGLLLKNALEGVGKPAEKVFDHLADDFTESTVICVATSGSASAIQGIGGTKGKSRHRYSICIFIAVPEPENVVWTAKLAQSKLNDMYIGARDVVLANKAAAGHWLNLKFFSEEGVEYGDFSQIIPVKVAGKDYDMEKIFVECEVFDV